MKICVCLHLYYLEMMQVMKEYVDHLDSYDLYITTPEENREQEQVILKVFRGARIIYTSNVGFDIYPFVCFLREVKLEEYDLVYKLHTKKDIPIEYSLNNYDLSNGNWRYYLLDSILGSKERTREIENIFEKQSDVGMIGSKELIILGDDMDKDIDVNEVRKTMEQIGLQLGKKEFIAGSMFVVRAGLLQNLKKRDFQEDEFPPYLPRTWNELPYCLERCMGCMISAQGYRLLGVYSQKSLTGKLPILKNYIRTNMPNVFNGLKKMRARIKR